MTITSDHIINAAKAIKELRPAYHTILEFYEQIFVAQEDSKSRIDIPPIKIPQDVLSVKQQKGFPLIGISEFVIDKDVSERLLREICAATETANNHEKSVGKELINAIDTKKIDPGSLFSNLLHGNDSFFENICTELDIEKPVLAFIIYSSIRPCVTLCAEQLSTYLKPKEENSASPNWGKGHCPICGNPPVISALEGEGERFLFCSFCWHKWPVRRLVCPFCENDDSKTLHYFYTEEEKEYRVNVCDKCKKYVKTVDTRKMDRFFYPPLEQISTLHLDMKAKEAGFEIGG